MTVEIAQIIFKEIVTPSIGLLFLAGLSFYGVVSFFKFIFDLANNECETAKDKRKKIDNFVLKEMSKRGLNDE